MERTLRLPQRLRGLTFGPRTGKPTVYNPYMLELTGTQRKYLRGLAHDLRPVMQIGKAGLSEGVFLEMERALEGHELVKVKFVDCKDRKRELCTALADRSRSDLVGLIGNVAIFYRPHQDQAKRRIRPPSPKLG